MFGQDKPGGWEKPRPFDPSQIGFVFQQSSCQRTVSLIGVVACVTLRVRCSIIEMWDSILLVV